MVVYHPPDGVRAVDVSQYWNSRYRHHAMQSEVSRQCSEGVVTGEDGVLAGVPGTLLHHVGARVLGDSIHRAGLWVGEGRLEGMGQELLQV